MLLYMIDTMEVREVSTSNIPGSFLQSDYDKGDIDINLKGGVFTLTCIIINILYTYIKSEWSACMKNPRRMSMEP